jgi:hypothetical protein
MKKNVSESATGVVSYKREAEALLKSCPSLASFRRRRLFQVFLKMAVVGITFLSLTGYLYFDTRQVAIAVVGGAFTVFALYKIANPRKNFQRRCGTIREITFFQTRVNNKNGPINMYGAMMDAVVLIVSLETPTGRRYKIELENRFQDLIKTGDVLIQLPGVPHFINKSPSDLVICPYCGNIMPRDSEDCVGCGRENIYGRN